MTVLRARVLPRYPIGVSGTNGISATIESGRLVIGPSFDDLALVTSLDNPEDKQVWVYDPSSGDYWRVSLQALVNAVSDFNAPSIVTGASKDVTSTETGIIISKTNPTSTAITLPAVLARSRLSLQIIDDSSIASGEHTITITPDGSEKIGRQSTWTLISTPDSLASIRLHPVPELGRWVIAP